MNVIEVPLTQNKVAIVDVCDFRKVSAYSWHFEPGGETNRNNCYAKTGIPHPDIPHRQKSIRMQHLILPPKKGFFIDHEDRNGLNNRRNNLRYCTLGQNIANGRNQRKGQYRGVHKQCKKWYAQISNSNNGNIYLGTFDLPEEAARAYDEAALEKWGEFASLNFPQLKEEL